MFDIYGGLRMTMKPSVFRKMDSVIAHKEKRNGSKINEEQFL